LETRAFARLWVSWKDAFPQRGFNSLWKKCFPRRSVTSAAKAGAENKPFIAAVNRCATQKQARTRVFSQAVKAARSQDKIQSEPLPFALISPPVHAGRVDER
jgi:hypothetical protein